MADEDDVTQVLGLEQRGDVGGVEVEVDVGADQVGAVAAAGQRRGVDLVADGPQPAGDLLVAPPPVAPAVDEDVDRHRVRARARP